MRLYNFQSTLVHCWPTSSPLLVPFWPTSGPLLVPFWPTSGPLPAHFWPISGTLEHHKWILINKFYKKIVRSAIKIQCDFTLDFPSNAFFLYLCLLSKVLCCFGDDPSAKRFCSISIIDRGARRQLCFLWQLMRAIRSSPAKFESDTYTNSAWTYSNAMKFSFIK